MNKLGALKGLLVVFSAGWVATYLTFLLACFRREDWQVLVGVATVGYVLYTLGRNTYLYIEHMEFQAQMAGENKKMKENLERLKAEWEAVFNRETSKTDKKL